VRRVLKWQVPMTRGSRQCQTKQEKWQTLYSWIDSQMKCATLRQPEAQVASETANGRAETRRHGLRRMALACRARQTAQQSIQRRREGQTRVIRPWTWGARRWHVRTPDGGIYQMQDDLDAHGSRYMYMTFAEMHSQSDSRRTQTPDSKVQR
jgi:hypothetical protein